LDTAQAEWINVKKRIGHHQLTLLMEEGEDNSNVSSDDAMRFC
jgi:hypothetical protein